MKKAFFSSAKYVYISFIRHTNYAYNQKYLNMKKTKIKPVVVKQRNTYTLETKANAKRLYLIGLTLLEIGKITDAPVRTIEKWQIADNWKQLKETTAVHLKALDLYNSGKTQKQIAKILNKSLPTIGRYIKTARNENEID